MLVFGKIPDRSQSLLVMIWLLASLCFSLESALKSCGEYVVRAFLEGGDSCRWSSSLLICLWKYFVRSNLTARPMYFARVLNSAISAHVCWEYGEICFNTWGKCDGVIIREWSIMSLHSIMLWIRSWRQQNTCLALNSRKGVLCACARLPARLYMPHGQPSSCWGTVA